MMFYFAGIILGLLNTTLVSGISISIDSITSVHICSHPSGAAAGRLPAIGFNKEPYCSFPGCWSPGPLRSRQRRSCIKPPVPLPSRSIYRPASCSPPVYWLARKRQWIRSQISGIYIKLFTEPYKIQSTLIPSTGHTKYELPWPALGPAGSHYGYADDYDTVSPY
jgi:hypothetical protein